MLCLLFVVRLTLTLWHCDVCSVCLCLSVLMGCTARLLFCCGSSLVLFVVGRISGLGLGETHAGHLQSVSDSPGVCSDCVFRLLNVC